jgi:hypothetical protein
VASPLRNEDESDFGRVAPPNGFGARGAPRSHLVHLPSVLPPRVAAREKKSVCFFRSCFKHCKQRISSPPTPCLCCTLLGCVVVMDYATQAATHAALWALLHPENRGFGAPVPPLPASPMPQGIPLLQTMLSGLVRH